jgi:hypothetical protein
MQCERDFNSTGAMPSRRPAKNGMSQPIATHPVTAADSAHVDQLDQTCLEPVTAIVASSPRARAKPQLQRRGISVGRPTAATAPQLHALRNATREAAAPRDTASAMRRLHQFAEQEALEDGSSGNEDADDDDWPKIVPSLLDRIVGANSSAERCPPGDDPPVSDGDKWASDAAEHDSDPEEDSIAAAASRIAATPGADLQLRAVGTSAGEESARQTSGSPMSANTGTPPTAAPELSALQSRPAPRPGQQSRRSPTRGAPAFTAVICEADLALEAVRQQIVAEIREGYDSSSSMSAGVAPLEDHDLGAAVVIAPPALAQAQGSFGESPSKICRKSTSQP